MRTILLAFVHGASSLSCVGAELKPIALSPAPFGPVATPRSPRTGTGILRPGSLWNQASIRWPSPSAMGPMAMS